MENKMTIFNISVGAVDSDYDAAEEAGAILAYVRDAGYASVAEAADVCGQNVADFMDNIKITLK